MRIATNALSLLRHRGQEGEGVTGYESSAVGMCRLAVRGDSAMTVPFASDAFGAVAYNGEVYTVRSGSGATVPRDGSDEAAAIAAGDSVDGMFALAQCDRNGRITADRDPWGIKPMFLSTGPDTVTLASETVALRDLVPDEVDTTAVAEFLALGFPVSGASFRPGVAEVPPGSRVHVADGRVLAHERDHWTIPGVTGVTPGQGRVPAPEEVREAVRQSLLSCLVTDRPLGLAVSGGLDSTILAAELSLMGVESLRTVSIVYGDPQDGVRDLVDLNLPGDAWRTWRHTAVEFGAEDWLNGLAPATRALGRPTALTSDPMYLALARLAADAGIVVLLLGEGVDELFCGYRSYLDVPVGSTPADHYLRGVDGNLMRELLGAGFANARDNLLASLAISTPSDCGVLDQLRTLEPRRSLQPLLARADHLLMTHTIEGRTPFLHGDVPRIAWEAPTSALLEGDTTKALLRRAYAQLLPGLAAQRKRPFRAPSTAWNRGPVLESLVDLVLRKQGALEAMGVDANGVRRWAAAARSGRSASRDVAPRLASLAIWANELGSALDPGSSQSLP